ncbi:MAG: rhodanese-like domain-containing protein [Verrucomicrobiales bacterium]|nr:rhodanese-like domain-containing protein [Verrucomicrobiales bacterium]
MNWTPYLFAGLVLVVIVVAWYAFEGSWDRKLFVSREGKVCVNLNGGEAARYLREHPETQVLDVRSEGEHAGGALPGAVNVSLGDAAFEEKVGVLDRSRPVLVYCAGGFRSRKAVEKLKTMGFENIQHLHRGYMSWKPDKTS